jgi:hypothetical protein
MLAGGLKSTTSFLDKVELLLDFVTIPSIGPVAARGAASPRPADWRG